MKTLKVLLIIHIAALSGCLTSCADLTASIKTPYGNVQTDGKKVDVNINYGK